MKIKEKKKKEIHCVQPSTNLCMTFILLYVLCQQFFDAIWVYDLKLYYATMEVSKFSNIQKNLTKNQIIFPHIITYKLLYTTWNVSVCHISQKYGISCIETYNTETNLHVPSLHLLLRWPPTKSKTILHYIIHLI